MTLSSAISAILDNSTVWRRLGEIGRNSASVSFSLQAARTTAVIIQTSRVAGLVRCRVFPVFLVGDYLNRESAFLLDACERSVAFGFCRKAVFSAAGKIRALAGRVFYPGGRLLSWLSSFGKEFERAGRRKMITATVLLFMAAFYLLRWILLRLFPGAFVYSRWSTGIILAILLAVLLYLTAGSNNRAER